MSKSDSFDKHMLPQRNDLVSAGAKTAPVRTNGIPLSTFTDPASLRLEHKYNWQTGRVEDVRGDILSNARRHMGRLKFHAETAERTHPHDHDSCYMGPCKGMVAPTPALSGGTKKRKGK
jgi:hypothetical protein